MAGTIDIVICTYDREELLLHCLNSLQLQSDLRFSVTLVNNFIRPLSEEVRKQVTLLPHAVVIDVSTPGLSIARNAGIAVSTNSWIAFLDDDAKAPVDYIAQIHNVIANHSFSCFGGGINSWWFYGRTRWLPLSFGSKPALRSTRGIIEEGYNWGSNIIINRAALLDVGGFPEEIGMSGTHIGYAAENIVQMKLRAKGYSIGYDPDLVIDHIVAAHKLNLGWHIRSAYATGRDGIRVFRDQYGMRGVLTSLKQCFTRPLSGIVSLFGTGYYWENWVLDLCQPWALLIGKIVAVINR